MGAAEPEKPAFVIAREVRFSAGFGDPLWLIKSTIILITEANRKS
jgi:hypothetical protein